jgi:hypothetical protein
MSEWSTSCSALSQVNSRSRSCGRVWILDWSREFTGKASIRQKVGESHCDRFGMIGLVKKFDVVVWWGSKF